jgi:transposase
MAKKMATAAADGVRPGAEVARAPAGDKVVTGGGLGSKFVAALGGDKYDDGLPLHVQKRRFVRMGASVAVSTLANHVMLATDLLRRLWRVVTNQVLAAMVMHLDATGLPVLDRGAAGGTQPSRSWMARGCAGR